MAAPWRVCPRREPTHRAPAARRQTARFGGGAPRETVPRTREGSMSRTAQDQLVPPLRRLVPRQSRFTPFSGNAGPGCLPLCAIPTWWTAGRNRRETQASWRLGPAREGRCRPTLVNPFAATARTAPSRHCRPRRPCTARTGSRGDCRRSAWLGTDGVGFPTLRRARHGQH